MSVVLLRVSLGSAGPLCFKQLGLAFCLIMAWALFCSIHNSSGAQVEGAETLLTVYGRNAGRQAQWHTFHPAACVKAAYLQRSPMARRNHQRLNALDLSILKAPSSSEDPGSILVSLTHTQSNIPFLKCPSETSDQNKSCLQDLILMCN